jgi:predicted PurR-regulated permease PerM
MNDHSKTTMNYRRASLFMLGLIAFIVACAALKFTTAVVLPFVIAVLLTFVLEPLVAMLTKLKIPRSIAAILIVLFIGIAVYMTGFILFKSVGKIATLYPKYEVRFSELYFAFADAFGISYDEHLSLFENLWSHLNVRTKTQSLVFQFSEAFLLLLKDTVMVTLFIVFLLLEIGHFRDRAEIAFASAFPRGVTSVIESVVVQVTRYLSLKFFLSLATGALVGFFLYLIGMDFPVVWGLISFILNFIPTIGSIAAGLGISAFALVQFYPEPVPIALAISAVLGVNMIIGNVIEPKIQGDNLGLSPFVILVSLLGWGWLWGFVGLVLAVPMTVIVKIFCENIPGLEPVSIMIGSYRAAKEASRQEDEEDR